MTTRQKTRNLARQPVEERVRFELQQVAGDRASVDIEVHDHGEIRGGVITASLKRQLPPEQIDTLRAQLVSAARESIPVNHPLGTWSLVLRQNEQPLGTAHWFEAEGGNCDVNT